MTRRAGSRRGLSLIEVMIAITLLSVIVATMGAISVGLAHTAFAVSGDSFVTAEMTWHVNRLMSLPYDSLPAEAGSVSVAATPYPYTRSVALTTLSATSKRVQLVIAPANTRFRPDTVLFVRSKPVTNPLNAP